MRWPQYSKADGRTINASFDSRLSRKRKSAKSGGEFIARLKSIDSQSEMFLVVQSGFQVGFESGWFCLSVIFSATRPKSLKLRMPDASSHGVINFGIMQGNRPNQIGYSPDNLPGAKRMSAFRRESREGILARFWST